jgi:REP element-mobilizing transposase RayT
MRVFGAVREAIRLAQRDTFRICHFSVQSNHIHMLVEAKSRQALSRGVQGLAIRMARAINRVLRRMGKVWADRHHRRDLATPREVRHALVYVLMNYTKHGPASRAIDGCSSGPWFTGWRDYRPVTPAGVEAPVLSPRTWLLGAGWRRLGLIVSAERPRGGPT